MPRFYFDLIEDGKLLRDETGVALDSIDAAKAEARKALADMIREEIRDGGEAARGEVTIKIRDTSEDPLILSVTYVITGSD